MRDAHWLGLWSIAISCFVFWLYWTLRVRFSGRKNVRIRIVTITGPSCAGKGTIVEELLKRHPEWGLVVSLTSRAPRGGRDLPGEYRCNLSEEYLCRLDAEGKALWREGEHGNMYVTLFKDVNYACRFGTLSFMQILHRSVVKLHSYIPGEVLSIFIIPPGEEELRRRFATRGDSPEQTERRIADCGNWEEEARASDIPYHYVKNDGTVEEAVEKVEDIISRYV